MERLRLDYDRALEALRAQARAEGHDDRATGRHHGRGGEPPELDPHAKVARCRSIDYIQRYGFRRWYERQLIESHAYLALGFVALIMMLAGVEVMGDMKSSTGYVCASCGWRRWAAS